MVKEMDVLNFQVATCINYWNMVLLPPFSYFEAEFLVPLHVIIFLVTKWFAELYESVK